MPRIAPYEPETPPEPWERQAGETVKAFAAFTLYRDAGPHRSFRATAEAYYRQVNGHGPPAGKEATTSQLRTWARDTDWHARVLAWDREQQRLINEARVEAIKEMVARHVRVSEDVLEVATTQLNRMKGDEKLALTPADVLRYAEVGQKMERLSRGEATEVVAQQGMEINVNVDIHNVLAAKLDAMAARMRAAEVQAVSVDVENG